MFKKMGQKQKRSTKRLPVYHLAKYRYVSETEKPMVLFTVKDISENGMRCHVDRPLQEGSVLEIEVQFPFLDQPESCFATVMWIKKIGSQRELYEAGIKFNGVDDFLTRALEKRKF